MRILNTILLVLILTVASGGAAYYYFNTNGHLPAAHAQEAGQPAVPAPIFLALDPFTVTLSGERGNRILYTEITLRLNESASHTTLMQYMPEVRNRILAELARHTAADLRGTEGRNDLAGDLKKVLAAPFHPHLNPPGISSVLFTAFVIQ